MYYQSDYILRLIEDAAKFLAKVLEHHQNSEIEQIVNEDGVIDELTFFEYRLNKHFYAGNYCEAEDMLFRALNQPNGEKYLNTALRFYQQLGEADSQKLEANGYSEERILEGLKKLRGFYPVAEDETAEFKNDK